jgi:hypothetical protein
MYDFAIMALLALAVVKAVDFLAGNLTPLDRFRSVLTFVAAVLAVWALDYSLFERFDIAVRDRSTGVWMSGLMVAGMTVPWRALFGWLTHDRAEKDEVLGDRSHSLRSAA